MIAVVSSTIKPSVKKEKAISFYSFDERLQQTLSTVKRLEECGFKDIYLVDNSPDLDQAQLQHIFLDFPAVKPFHLQQFQFANKGITELLMLLYVIQYLPANQEIFKISGRYYPSAAFKKPGIADLAVRAYNFNNKKGAVSTRGYWVKNAETLQRFLLNCLEEVFAYPERLTGIRGLFKLLLPKNKVKQPMNISIEFAAANVLKSGAFRVNLIDPIGIEGYIAGIGYEEKITE